LWESLSTSTTNHHGRRRRQCAVSCYSGLLGCEALGLGLLRGREELLDLFCRWRRPRSASDRGCRGGRQSLPSTTVARRVVRGLAALLVAAGRTYPCLARRRRLPPGSRTKIIIHGEIVVSVRKKNGKNVEYNAQDFRRSAQGAALTSRGGSTRPSR
jgi:hypothetical protein